MFKKLINKLAKIIVDATEETATEYIEEKTVANGYTDFSGFELGHIAPKVRKYSRATETPSAVDIHLPWASDEEGENKPYGTYVGEYSYDKNGRRI